MQRELPEITSSVMESRAAGRTLTRGDALLLVGFCLLFFGLSLVGGRPLTMHEGVLPQTAREMAADHDWVIPKNGGRPWLESPPLPQWITVGLYSVCGASDQLWVARIGPALMGTVCVLLLAWMSAHWFGRTVGLLSGFVFATMYEIVQYAWLAEDEIYLCALVTAAVASFVQVEFVRGDSSAQGSRNFFGTRPWSLVVFYVALGMTNLAKGLLFGTVMAAVSMGVFLLWNRDWKRIAFYCWIWGWLLYAAIALAWPLAAYLRYPDVTNVWFFDHVGRLDGDYQALTKPVWYYLKALPGVIAPWTIVAPLGLWLTRRAALTGRYSPERFVWCWAIATPVVFSLPTGKNHHYLLQCAAPWAPLCAIALVWLHRRFVADAASVGARIGSVASNTAASTLRASRIGADAGSIRHGEWIGLTIAALVPLAALALFWKRLPEPGLVPLLAIALPILSAATVWAIGRPAPRVAGAALIGAVALAFSGGHLYAGRYVDLCREDTSFLQKVRRMTQGKPVFIDTKLGSLDEFRILYYLDSRTKALHNVTFLADDRIADAEVYVVARASLSDKLEEFGQVDEVLQSRQSRREKTPQDRFTLFRLRYAADRPRVAADTLRITPMQVMQREDGPYLR